MFERFRASAFAPSDDVAGGLLAEALRFAMDTRATADTEVRFAGSPAVEIVKRANAIEADLVVIGAQVRRVPKRRPSLGPNVEHVLEHCPQTVVVVAMPDQRSS